jgi:hypothetical protein
MCNVDATTPWDLGTDLSDVGTDQATVAVVMTATDTAEASIANMDGTEFEDDDVLDDTTWLQMDAGTDICGIGNPGPAQDYGDDVAKDTYNAKVLFYRIAMPTDVSSGETQRLSINIRAVTSGSF